MVTPQKSWVKKALWLSSTTLSIFILVIGFLALVDGGMGWTESGVLAAEGFELQDGRVVDTQLTTMHSAPEVDELVERSFDLGMTDGAQASYHSVYSALFEVLPDGDRDPHALESFQQSYGKSAEAAMDAYVEAGSDLFPGGSGSTIFLRSLVMQSILRHEAGQPEHGRETLGFAMEYLVRPKWYGTPDELAYFYDAKSWNMLLFATDHFRLIREMEPPVRRELIHQISATIDVLQAAPWHRTWKRTIAQTAVDAFENNDPWATAMFESAGARFRLKLYQSKSMLANLAMRADVNTAFAICNGQDVIRPLFFNEMSAAATNVMQSTEANYAVLRLKLRLLACVVLLENYRDETGHLPTDFSEIDASDVMAKDTLEVDYAVEGDAYTLTLKWDDYMESWPRSQSTLTSRR